LPIAEIFHKILDV